MQDYQLELLASLPVPDQYTPLDRYHDFREVFLKTEQGRRVLKQILVWGHLLERFKRTLPIDPHMNSIAEGERSLALAIFTALSREPSTRPETQTTVVKEE